jgi:hypothetical protein
VFYLIKDANNLVKVKNEGKINKIRQLVEQFCKNRFSVLIPVIKEVKKVLRIVNKLFPFSVL